MTKSFSPREASVPDVRWTDREREIARRVFESALNRELSEVIADFKSKAARVAEPDDMGALQGYLRGKQQEMEQRYDFRYSQLIIVFGNLLRQNRIMEGELAGLSEEKLSQIRFMASM